MNMPEEERFLMTKDEMLAQITTFLAGRAAEEVQFGEMTTGAANDIERATKMARSMVTQYGMSEEFDMMGLESVQNQYLDGRNVATASEATGQAIDSEVGRIIKECHQQAVSLLQENKAHLSAIADFLLKKETITGAEFMEILQGPPALPEPE
jgi:cell division protease FtsH